MGFVSVSRGVWLTDEHRVGAVHRLARFSQAYFKLHRPGPHYHRSAWQGQLFLGSHSDNARTYFGHLICGPSEDNRPHTLQKAQSSAFSEENRTQEGVPAGRLTIVSHHLPGRWWQPQASGSQSRRNRKGSFNRCSISRGSSQGPVRVLRIKPIAACTPSVENNPANSLEKRARVLIRCARRMR